MTETKARNAFTYDHANGAVIRDGIAYPLGALSESDKLHCGLRGLAAWLGTQEDPQAAYSAVKAGTKSVKREAKVEPIDPWREAAAIVHAESQIKGVVKPPPGKRLRDTPEFQTALAAARTTTAAWNKAELGQAKAHAQVVAERNALIGVKGDLGALFAAKVEAPADDVRPDETFSEAA